MAHGVEGTAIYKPPNAVLYAIGGYFAIINVGAVGLFWYDKQQALKRQWRVPERQLQLTGLLGGWIGGLWAMQTFRHKTVKKSFKEPYMSPLHERNDCSQEQEAVINIKDVAKFGSVRSNPFFLADRTEQRDDSVRRTKSVTLRPSVLKGSLSAEAAAHNTSCLRESECWDSKRAVPYPEQAAPKGSSQHIGRAQRTDIRSLWPQDGASGQSAINDSWSSSQSGSEGSGKSAAELVELARVQSAMSRWSKVKVEKALGQNLSVTKQAHMDSITSTKEDPNPGLRKFSTRRGIGCESNSIQSGIEHHASQKQQTRPCSPISADVSHQLTSPPAASPTSFNGFWPIQKSSDSSAETTMPHTRSDSKAVASSIMRAKNTIPGPLKASVSVSLPTNDTRLHEAPAVTHRLLPWITACLSINMSDRAGTARQVPVASWRPIPLATIRPNTKPERTATPETIALTRTIPQCDKPQHDSTNIFAGENQMLSAKNCTPHSDCVREDEVVVLKQADTNASSDPIVMEGSPRSLSTHEAEHESDGTAAKSGDTDEIAGPDSPKLSYAVDVQNAHDASSQPAEPLGARMEGDSGREHAPPLSIVGSPPQLRRCSQSLTSPPPPLLDPDSPVPAVFQVLGLEPRHPESQEHIPHRIWSPSKLPVPQAAPLFDTHDVFSSWLNEGAASAAEEAPAPDDMKDEIQEDPNAVAPTVVAEFIAPAELVEARKRKCKGKVRFGHASKGNLESRRVFYPADEELDTDWSPGELQNASGVLYFRVTELELDAPVSHDMLMTTHVRVDGGGALKMEEQEVFVPAGMREINGCGDGAISLRATAGMTVQFCLQPVYTEPSGPVQPPQTVKLDQRKSKLSSLFKANKRKSVKSADEISLSSHNGSTSSVASLTSTPRPPPICMSFTLTSAFLAPLLDACSFQVRSISHPLKSATAHLSFGYVPLPLTPDAPPPHIVLPVSFAQYALGIQVLEWHQIPSMEGHLFLHRRRRAPRKYYFRLEGAKLHMYKPLKRPSAREITWGDGIFVSSQCEALPPPPRWTHGEKVGCFELSGLERWSSWNGISDTSSDTEPEESDVSNEDDREVAPPPTPSTTLHLHFRDARRITLTIPASEPGLYVALHQKVYGRPTDWSATDCADMWKQALNEVMNGVKYVVPGWGKSTV
ncbi:hypothetical protein HDU85_007526 [Gaertneriomyces sp. JEL0708]|nr:hypothetical protein HDU85_007526 [Gaertneriomyces sp. JEL0708]